MTKTKNHIEIFRAAGLFTWVCTGMPLLFVGFHMGLSQIELWGWRLSYLLFGACFLMLMRALPRRKAKPKDWVVAFIMTTSAILVSHFSGSGLGGSLLLVSSGVLPWILPRAYAIAWLILQYVAMLPVFLVRPEFHFTDALLQGILYIGFSSFVFVVSSVARGQTEAREEQRRLIAELRATRALLAEGTKLSERTRISRELHDLLGHHLTALSLNLEVAGHLIDGKPKEHVQQAQTVAKLLLSDVREAVSMLRDEDTIDLKEALDALKQGVPALRVQLDMPEDLAVSDPSRAHVLIRCAQEIMTNAIRHGKAKRLTMSFRREGGLIVLQADDDGIGAHSIKPGNGLTGMRERVAKFGGTVGTHSSPWKGFSVLVRLPDS